MTGVWVAAAVPDEVLDREGVVVCFVFVRPRGDATAPDFEGDTGAAHTERRLANLSCDLYASRRQFARPPRLRARQARSDLGDIPQARRALAEIAHEPPPRRPARPSAIPLTPRGDRCSYLRRRPTPIRRRSPLPTLSGEPASVTRTWWITPSKSRP